jgi:dCTP deaminase
VLLSDKDIRAEIDAGRVRIDPYDESMVQPSSVDVRLDRFFRVFENHRYPHIDPSVEQADLTRLVEPEGDEPFILHPGEFVLASTYEVITPPTTWPPAWRASPPSAGSASSPTPRPASSTPASADT